MNRFKEKIDNKEKPIGTFIGTGSATVVECMGRAGFDYVIFDNEHSPIEAETSAELVRAAENAGITPLARVREISRPAILKLLDVGVQGLIIPNVMSVEDVRKIVSYGKYSPIGNRGFCPSRKDGWGCDLKMSVRDTMDYFNKEVQIIPQCETAEALEVIEEIAAVEGVDGIFIGPFDLSISMGIPGDFTNPKFISALERIMCACRKNGKFCMLFAGSSEAVFDGLKKGYDSITYSLDTMLMIEAIKEKVDDIRNNF